EGRLAHVQVAQDFAVLRDGAGAESVLLVVVLVVADVQYECKIRTQRNEFVELNVVANSPRHAAQDSDGCGKQRPGDRVCGAIETACTIGGPQQQDGKQQSDGGIGEQRQAPQETVERPIHKAA